jgi:hypothetical protein
MLERRASSQISKFFSIRQNRTIFENVDIRVEDTDVLSFPCYDYFPYAEVTGCFARFPASASTAAHTDWTEGAHWCGS